MTVIKAIETALSGHLPGKAVQYEMAPEDRDQKEGKFSARTKKGGVLILLFPKNGKLHFLLMKRAESLRFHGGQISLPGGTYDDTDKTLEQTALRETYEETGVRLTPDNILGALTPLYIPVSDFQVFPFVGYTSATPVWQKNTAEVNSLIEVPLNHFLQLSPAILEQHHHGQTIKIPYFPIETFIVWGATAMILNEFKAVLKNCNFKF